MMASLVVVECWSGPACGISVEVDDSVLSFFVRLAIRVDDTKTFGVALSYQFRRWLRVGAEITHTKRDSNTPVFTYSRDQIFFTVGATL